MNYFHGTAVAAHDLKLAARGGPNSARFWMFFAGCGVACVLVVLKPILGLGIIGTVVGSCLCVYLFVDTLSGKIEAGILTWVLIFPLGYYFMSFLREDSIIALDRMF